MLPLPPNRLLPPGAWASLRPLRVRDARNPRVRVRLVGLDLEGIFGRSKDLQRAVSGGATTR